MCTCSILPLADGAYRLCFNRDESPARPPAEAPTRQQAGEQSWLAPRDPRSDGTWLAVNADGLSFALLNRNDQAAEAWHAVSGDGRSRGGIIPALVGQRSVQGVRDALSALINGGQPFSPFRLLVCDGATVHGWSWDGVGDLRVEVEALRQPRFWASSGLGDQRVQGPRAAVFARQVLAHWPAQDDARDGLRESALIAGQDAFHRDRSGPDSAAWVLMRRSDARSLSLSTITYRPAGVEMTQQEVSEDGCLLGSAAPLRLRVR